MDVAFWVSLTTFVLASIGGLTLAGLRALHAWRAVRRLRRRTGEGLLEITRKLARAEAGLTAAGESMAELDRARTELREALAAASALTAAAGEASALIGRARGIVPRK